MYKALEGVLKSIEHAVNNGGAPRSAMLLCANSKRNLNAAYKHLAAIGMVLRCEYVEGLGVPYAAAMRADAYTRDSGERKSDRFIIPVASGDF